VSAVDVVTGATSGIGLATAHALAARGNAVLLVGRDPVRTRAAVELVQAGTGAPVRGFLADLASQRDVRQLACDLRRAIDRDDLSLAAVVHSAGVFSSRRVLTDDGIELTFAVNHLAPFLLTHELVDGLGPDAVGRVVVVGSNAHRAATIDPDRVAWPRRYRALRAYNQSKLANELFVRALASRLDGIETGAFVVDPGLVDTAIGTKHSGPAARLVWQLRRRLGTSPDAPARTIAALAAGELGRDESGTTWRDGRRIEPSAWALDGALAERLWETSSALCGVSRGAAAVPR
jgi:NAD(P)-dependent dehydrogenase (short-subunit alcohol dehydrogenase family)